MPSPRHRQVYICPLAGTRCCGHYLSRNMLEVKYKLWALTCMHGGKQSRYWKQPFLTSLLSCCLPGMTVGRKTHSSEESKLEQLSFNESFLPPQDHFISNSVIFVNNEQISSGKLHKIFQTTTSAHLIFIKFASWAFFFFFFNQRFMNPWKVYRNMTQQHYSQVTDVISTPVRMLLYIWRGLCLLLITVHQFCWLFFYILVINKMGSMFGIWNPCIYT